MKKHGKIFEVPREAQAVNRAPGKVGALMDENFLAWLITVIVITALVLRAATSLHVAAIRKSHSNNI